MSTKIKIKAEKTYHVTGACCSALAAWIEAGYSSRTMRIWGAHPDGPEVAGLHWQKFKVRNCPFCGQGLDVQELPSASD